LPEWLVEKGIGETRAALVEYGRIIEARIEIDGTRPAGTILEARLVRALLLELFEPAEANVEVQVHR